MNHAFTYQAALEASQKINWKIEDVMAVEDRLDFSKPFLPESLARVDSLTFLTADERRTYNQIRGNGYLYTFGLVEEFILPFVMDHARPQLHGDDYRVRALLQFANEEAKHIHLFKRFCEEFERGFGSNCEVIGPPEAIASAVLAHDPLSVALVILHIEWMTQRHFTDSVKDDSGLDAHFKKLLRFHWMEEAQHAKLDTLMVEMLAEGRTKEQILEALDGYLQIGGMIDEGLQQQVQFDIAAFERATGRVLTDEERQEIADVQRQAIRWTFLGTGMTHPNFLSTLEALAPEARQRIEEVTPIFC